MVFSYISIIILAKRREQNGGKTLFQTAGVDLSGGVGQ